MARAATGPTTAPAIQALLEELPLPLEVDDVDAVVSAEVVDVDVALTDVVADVEVESAIHGQSVQESIINPMKAYRSKLTWPSPLLYTQCSPTILPGSHNSSQMEMH